MEKKGQNNQIIEDKNKIKQKGNDKFKKLS